MNSLATITQQLDRSLTARIVGRVVELEGATVGVAGLNVPVGAYVEIDRPGHPLYAEVIGFRRGMTLVAPMDSPQGVRRGTKVWLRQTRRRFRVGPALLGRVIDAQGKPLDDKRIPACHHSTQLHHRPPEVMQRPPISSPIITGIKAIDGLLTCGLGQRVGIFSGSGVGKSVTLGMMARNTSADVNVIALVGERGREVTEFIDRDLGPEGLRRSVVIVATSDQPAILRVQAAMLATSIAEYFRDEGNNVLLMMDSLTRFAMAQRELGLAAGEPPTTKGYPPSVFALLPQLVERAGRSPKGSITGFYTVLVEGDDTNEPIADAVRGLLDGHLVLTRQLAGQGHYPAIDILQSISRLMPALASQEHQAHALRVRQLLSAYQTHEDLISIGAYRTGANPQVDAAIQLRDPIRDYLTQDMHESSTWEQTQMGLVKLAQAAPSKSGAGAAGQTLPTPPNTQPASSAATTPNRPS